MKRIPGESLSFTRFVEGVSIKTLAHLTGTSPTTWEKWERTSAPAWALFVTEVVGGRILETGWEGWRFKNGRLLAPGHWRSYTPDRIESLSYAVAHFSELLGYVRRMERQLAEAERRVREMENDRRSAMLQAVELLRDHLLREENPHENRGHGHLGDPDGVPRSEQGGDSDGGRRGLHRHRKPPWITD